ncbi:DUF4340 domain-containing protein [Pontiella sp.]|uniref:DUF4340 domain-containing protein n=2 Tax=Pontiella sp. TaxID=2837462 RepID=UPI003565423E
MKGRSTIVLLIAIVVLGTFIGIQESWRTRNSPAVIRRIRLFDLDPTSLGMVEFHLTNTVVRFSKENGVWMAGGTDAGMGRADVELIHRMVSGLNSMGKGTTITRKHLEIRGVDPSEYGFDNPLVEIRATDNEGKHCWVVGRRTPLGDMVYVKQEGIDDIYTVPHKLLSIVPSRPDLLRDRELFSGKAAGVRRIEIRGEAGFVQLVKDPQAGWRLQQPVTAPADPREVEEFIKKLYRLRIQDFVADNVSDFSIYGLQAETRQISLGGGDGTSRMLVIGGDVPDRPGFVYVRRSDDTSVFTLSADVLQLLNTPAKRIRNARVLDLMLGDITSISVKKGTEQLALALEPSVGWKTVSPVAWNADPGAVAGLARLWVDAVVIEYDVAINNVAPEWVFEYGSTLLGTTNHIEVLPSAGTHDGLLIRKGNDKTVHQVNVAEIPDEVVYPLTYKDSKVWDLDVETIGKISVTKDGQSRQVVTRLEDRSFVLEGTNGNVRVNSPAFAKLLAQLAVVRASGYIDYNPPDLAIYGLDHPALELHVGFASLNELGRVLLVGREVPEGFYSMVKGRDVVFLLDKSVVNALSANLLSDPQPPRAITGE